ncbi:hypothetical protein [Streptomyces sp. NPDC058953]|uniref:terpene synthase family protein n=1 Tax=unclassified Streptomyces TaxID=2593676 RepID=UPI003696404D
MTATSAALRFPYLHYPFPPGIHPETDQAETALIHWLTGHGLLTDPGLETALRHTRLSALTGREYLDADSDGLRVVTNVWCWILLVADRVRDPGVLGRNLAQLATFHAWMREIMEVGSVTAAESLALAATAGLNENDRNLCHGLAEAGQDVFRSIADRASSAQYMRFVAEMDYYFLGTLWEAGHRVRSTTPPPAEYAIGRRMTGGTLFRLSLQDIAGGYEVVPDDYLHPAVRTLRRHAANINCWCDDVISYGKERNASGRRPINLPTSLTYHAEWEEQGALEETARLHNREMEAYLSAEAEVATWAGPELSRFLVAMRTMLRGFYDWGLSCPRYDVHRYFDMVPRKL